MKKLILLIALVLSFSHHTVRAQRLLELPNKAYGIFSAQVTEAGSDGYLYQYTITNADSSEQVLHVFRISIADPSYYIENKGVSGPQAKKWYIDALSEGYISGSAASRYTNFPSDNGLALGESMEISFPSKGVPAIMTFYTKGFIKPLTMVVFDSLKAAGHTDEEIFLPWQEEYFQGTTITPKVWPEETTILNFADTLSSYLTRSCDELGWIPNQGICRSLAAKLENVQRQLERGNTSPARGSLQAFLNEVEAQKDKQLSSEAWALLWFNGQYLLERL
ncbi:MAG: hypothetical protein MK198_09425 [Gracilimonas sp.]|uniref:FIMAH domain-containing protein n=1 Tax=Gracilimonas sp. TaxID=1974203 RepID=UPI00375118EA|nr:hypothetical protein [Gracilimonas sp.]